MGNNQNTWSYRTKIIFREIKIIFHPLGSLAGFPARTIVLWQENVRGTRNTSLAGDPIGKYRVSPLRFLNTSAVIRYLICVYASHFFAGRPYHFNQTLRTANKFWNGDNRWVYRVCFEKYWSLMKVRNQPKLRRVAGDRYKISKTLYLGS
jgi:hypothetical protein